MSDLKQFSIDSDDPQKISLPSIGIPGEILFNPKLTSKHKILFGFIRNLSKSSRGCYATNFYLSGLVGCHKMTIPVMLKRLQEFGYIEIQYFRKDDRTEERRIYETTSYHETYKSLVVILNDLLYRNESNKIVAELEKEIGGLMQGLRGDNAGIIPYKDKEFKKELIVSKDTLNGSPEPSPKTSSCRFQRRTPIYPSTEQKKLFLDFIKPTTGEYAVLQAWNALPHPASSHKPNTKTARRIVLNLKEMRNGVFGRNTHRQWDGGWLDKHKIDQRKFEERKWTFREIIEVIKGPLTDMYREGFWPPEKNNLPHSLPDVFYNPRNRNSFFMIAAYDPPGQVKGKTEQDPYPAITKELTRMRILDPKRMKLNDWKRYFEGIKGLAGYLKEMDWLNYGARQMFPGGQKENPYSLVMEYVRWMRCENPDLLAPSKIPERFYAGMIRQDFWMWQKFMSAVNRYWGRVFLAVEGEEE